MPIIIIEQPERRTKLIANIKPDEIVLQIEQEAKYTIGVCLEGDNLTKFCDAIIHREDENYEQRKEEPTKQIANPVLLSDFESVIGRACNIMNISKINLRSRLVNEKFMLARRLIGYVLIEKYGLEFLPTARLLGKGQSQTAKQYYRWTANHKEQYRTKIESLMQRM